LLLYDFRKKFVNTTKIGPGQKILGLLPLSAPDAMNLNPHMHHKKLYVMQRHCAVCIRTSLVILTKVAIWKNKHFSITWWN